MSTPAETQGATARQLAVIEAMLDQVKRPALAELQSALAAALAEPPAEPAERREHELAFLAACVAEEMRQRSPGDGRPPRIERRAYEASSPPGAPTASALVKKYGSWLKACRAAHGLSGRGRVKGGSKPWATTSLGKKRNADYTRDEIVEAVIEVAGRLGRGPSTLTSNVYYDYVAEMRRRYRARGAPPPRWPTQRSVERFFPSWSEVRKATRSVS